LCLKKPPYYYHRHRSSYLVSMSVNNIDFILIISIVIKKFPGVVVEVVN
jgi:hypothetical protein